MPRHLTTHIISLLFLTLASSFVLAQEAEDETAAESEETGAETAAEEGEAEVVDYFSDIPEDFSGTLYEVDTESEEKRETELFGGEEEVVEGEEAEAVEKAPNHTLRFEFQGQVVITDTLTGSAYLEISYNLKLEQEVEIKDQRFRVDTEAQVITGVVGELTSNELSSCELDVQVPNPKIGIMLRHSQTEESEEAEATSQLAIQIDIDKNSIKEDWYANCEDMTGNTMNTKGEQEEYLFSLLNAATPELKGFVVDDYDPFVTTEQEVVAEPLIIEDPEAFEEFFLQGSGTLTIEPIE